MSGPLRAWWPGREGHTLTSGKQRPEPEGLTDHYTQLVPILRVRPVISANGCPY